MESSLASQEKPSNDKPSNIEEFAGYTTLHGLHFAISRGSIIRRVIWSLLLLAGVSFLVVQLHTSFKKLAANEFRVVKELEQADVVNFPALTICNNNMMKRSKILGTDAQYYLDQFEKQRNLSTVNNISASFNVEEAVRKNGHQLPELLLNCIWQGDKCSAENFTTSLSYTYGLCHTFNSGETGHPLLSVGQTGKDHGLTLILAVEPLEYYGLFSYFASGIRFLVHDQGELPLMDIYGMDAMPGFSTSVRLRRRKMHSLPAPYSTSCGERKLETFTKYSTSACLMECFAKITIARCGCRALSMPAVGARNDTKYCLAEDIEQCLGKDRRPGLRKGAPLGMSFNILRLNPSTCRCPTPCEIVEYRPTLNTAYFPAESFWDTLISLVMRNKTVSAAKKEAVKQGMRREIAVIQVYYEGLNTDVTKFVPSYGISEFGGDIGGNLGLFLGCSLLTLCEFIDFIVLALYTRHYNKSKRDTKVEMIG